MKKIRPIKNTWHDWLIIFLSVSALKDKIASLYKSITLEQTVSEQTFYGRGQKLSKPKKRIKAQIIKHIWNLFDTKEENEERKRSEKIERKNQEHNERLISNRIIRDIRAFFEKGDKDYLKPRRIFKTQKNKELLEEQLY